MEGSNLMVARPEMELMRCCARTRTDAAHAARIKQLAMQPALDWKLLVAAALQHGVVTLLFWQLNAVCPELVPPVHLNQLQQLFRRNTVHNLSLIGELSSVLKLFEEHGIRAVPFKGPTLAVVAYGDVRFRQFTDLDILIREGDVLRAKDLLVARGYKPDGQLLDEHYAGFLHSEYVYSFMPKAEGRPIELHWRFVPQYFVFPFETSDLWHRLETVTLPGAIVPGLPLEDLLLILCAHGTKHLWERLCWICDIAELIGRHQGLDWERLWAAAAALGSERMLLLGLLLAEQLLDAVLPRHVIERIRADRSVEALAAQVCARFAGDDIGKPLQAGETFAFHLRARERVRDRILYCSRVALVPSIADWSFLALPSSLSFLYYLLRPVRLARDYGLNRWKRVV